MPMTALSAYLERLPARIAEWKMAMSEATMLPHLNVAERNELVETWRAQAQMQELEAETPSPAVLKLLGIGVVKNPTPNPSPNEEHVWRGADGRGA